MDGSNYLDWELQIKTLLQYHHLSNVVNDSEKKTPVTSSSSSSSTTSVISSSKVEIEAWLDKDSHDHAFLVFNINPTIARQFQDNDEEKANKLLPAIKSEYHRVNHAQMPTATLGGAHYFMLIVMIFHVRFRFTCLQKLSSLHQISRMFSRTRLKESLMDRVQQW